MKKLYILGISGTFMSALAILAKEAGYEVRGCDANCYSPVRELLAEKNIPWDEGYDNAAPALAADMVIVGNAIKRGMPIVEAVLNAGCPMISGPQWLAENILSQYQVLAVAGTHGKTTTTAMITHIMHQSGLNPGFLIGGVLPQMHTNARLGDGAWFVIEADEYDSAFFDKRPKLIHYRPKLAILNNLEFDHADIYSDIAAIQQQFQYFLRTIAGNGFLLFNADDTSLAAVIKAGVYCHAHTFALNSNADWKAVMLHPDGRAYEIWYQGEKQGEIHWSLLGAHNVANGLASVAACVSSGLNVSDVITALETFTPVKRRLEKIGDIHGVVVYDDFAHHPTAISATIAALHHSARHQRIIAVVELASYTMRQGTHQEALVQALHKADLVVLLNPETFSLRFMQESQKDRVFLEPSPKAVVQRVMQLVKSGDAVLIMSNRDFGNVHKRLLQDLEKKATL